MLVLTLRDADWPKLCSINKWEPSTHFSFSSSVGKLQISSRGSSKFMVGHVLTLLIYKSFPLMVVFLKLQGFFCQFQLVSNILHLVLQYHFTATLFFFSLLSVFFNNWVTQRAPVSVYSCMFCKLHMKRPENYIILCTSHLSVSC